MRYLHSIVVRSNAGLVYSYFAFAVQGACFKVRPSLCRTPHSGASNLPTHTPLVDNPFATSPSSCQSLSLRIAYHEKSVKPSQGQGNVPRFTSTLKNHAPSTNLGVSSPKLVRMKHILSLLKGSISQLVPEVTWQPDRGRGRINLLQILNRARAQLGMPTAVRFSLLVQNPRALLPAMNSRQQKRIMRGRLPQCPCSYRDPEAFQSHECNVTIAVL